MFGRMGAGDFARMGRPKGMVAGAGAQPVIIDTDNDSDCGDAAALGLLLQLEALGECRVIAVTVASENTKAAPCTRVMFNYAGRSAVPLGALQDTGRITSSGSNYDSTVVTNLGVANSVSTAAVRTDYSSAVTVMRTALAALSGQKAKIIVIGTVTNVSDLLDSAADGISALNGVDLVTAKVSEFHVMGGAFPTSDIDEHNITFDVTSANNFATKTPVPVYWQGYHIGDTFNTAPPTYGDPSRDPFWLAFTASSLTTAKSYDQMAVLAAVRPTAGYFTYTGPGDVTFSSGVGNTAWSSNAAGKHSYSSKAISDGAFTTLINALLATFMLRLDVWGPTFTSLTTDSVPEAHTLSHALTTSETATFTLVGGADQARFEISGSTLRWLSDGTKTYASPDDADTNNTYVVTVRGTDTKGNITDQTITVTVTQVVAFTPADLTPNLWLQAGDIATLWQNVAGSSAVSADGQTVGKWDDKSGAGFHLTAAADDTTRPTYKADGGAGAKPYVLFDGSNDVLRRLASLGSFAAGACSIFAAVKGNPATSARLFAQGRSSDDQPVYALLQAGTATASTGGAFVRNDATTVMASNINLQVNAFDNTDNVYGVVDNGSSYTPYLDGVAGSASSYTRSGTITGDRTALGALVRATIASWWAGRVYAIVVVNRALTGTEIINLTTYFGALMDRTL